MNREKIYKIYIWEPVGLVYIRKKPILQGFLPGPTGTDILTFPLVATCFEHFTVKFQLLQQ